LARFLVVDDDRDFRDALTAALELSGHVVAEATNGRAALLSNPEQFELILLDLHMPVMDGRDFKRALDDKGVTVPILLISAEPQLARAAAELGVTTFLTKKSVAHALETTVAKMLAHTGADCPSSGVSS
jgi:CheY-like chemotaxis protein